MSGTAGVLAEAFIQFRDWRARAAWVGAMRSKGVRIEATVRVTLDSAHRIAIGTGSFIGSYTTLDAGQSPNADGSLRDGRIEIGSDVYIGSHNHFGAGGAPLLIGDRCLISQMVAVIGANHLIHRALDIRDQDWDPQRAGVVIGRAAWIGSHVVILPGVAIGDGAVVAAGAVVTRSVPPYAIVSGAPARVVGERT